MKFGKSVLFLVSMTLASVALAGHHEKTRMVIVVDDDTDGEETRVELDSRDLGFSLRDLQVGESRSVVDSQGRSILITRLDDGFEIDVDGKKVDLPAFHGGHHREHMAMVHPHAAVPIHGPDGILIISGESVDEATRQQITALLEAAGHTSGVRFIDHESAKSGQHRIKIVEKRIDKGTD